MKIINVILTLLKKTVIIRQNAGVLGKEAVAIAGYETVGPVIKNRRKEAFPADEGPKTAEKPEDAKSSLT